MTVVLKGVPVAHDRDLADRLRAIWSELLRGVDVRDSDHFVALGGDSIAATVCAIRIREAFGVDVGVATLLLDDVSFTTLVEDVRRRMAAREASPCAG